MGTKTKTKKQTHTSSAYQHTSKHWPFSKPPVSNEMRSPWSLRQAEPFSPPTTSLARNRAQLCGHVPQAAGQQYSVGPWRKQRNVINVILTATSDNAPRQKRSLKALKILFRLKHTYWVLLYYKSKVTLPFCSHFSSSPTLWRMPRALVWRSRPTLRTRWLRAAGWRACGRA